MQSEVGDLCSATEALRNPLVLHEIFKNLSNRTLLLSCSLVNRMWNREARLLVRDHRKCRVQFKCNTCACNFISEMNELCENIVNSNRIVPFNKVRIHMFFYRSVTKNYQHALKATRLTNSFGLKYLKIEGDSWAFKFSCFKPVLKDLLCHSTAELRVLRLYDLYYMEKNTASLIATFNFPKLEELTVWPNFPYYKWPQAGDSKTLKMRKYLCRMLQNAPKLARIKVVGPISLRIIPPDRYGLLTELSLFIRDLEGLILYRKITASKPALGKLKICHENNIAPDEDDLEIKHYAVLERLLQICHSTLHIIEAEPIKPLPKLSYPPLVNVKYFKLTVRHSNFEGLREIVKSFDFRKNMPALDQVHISMFFRSFDISVYDTRRPSCTFGPEGTYMIESWSNSDAYLKLIINSKKLL